MAKVQYLHDVVTQEPYYREIATGRALRRIVGGLAWPAGETPGSLAVLGELRARQNVIDRVHELVVLREFQSASLARLIEEARLMQEMWLMRTWVTPVNDQRVYLLDDANDAMRAERRRPLRYSEPQGWRGQGEGLIPFYLALVQRRTERDGIKSLFFGANSPGAQEMGRLMDEDMRRNPTDFPAAAAVWFAVAEFDMDRQPEWGERRLPDRGPADTLGGY